ncbi:hypothetical protein L7F22_052610 [Adiantum nelumboides]|nr:hypothetical protein [Adiantum nelumboides]
MPEMPEFQGTEEEEQPRPAPGALDIREQMEQEIEDMPEGPAKEYLMYEKKVMESAALAFLQPKEQIKDFDSDFLPPPLMRHEANLWKEKMRPAVPRNEDGGYEGIPLTSKQEKTLIEDHPRWRKKWLSECPRDLTNFHNTPQTLHIDPTYCSVPRRRSWAEFQKWKGKNKALHNYPVLSAQKPPTVNYVVNTMNQTIQLLREVSDLTCQMLVKIARMIITCIQVFRDTEDDDHPWNLFLEGRRGICWNLRDSPSRWIIMALYSRLMYLPSHFLQTFEEAFVTEFFKISTQIFHPMAKDLKASLDYKGMHRVTDEEDFDDTVEDLDGATDYLSDRRKEEEVEESDIFSRLVAVAVIQHAIVIRRRFVFDPLGSARAGSRVQPGGLQALEETAQRAEKRFGVSHGKASKRSSKDKRKSRSKRKKRAEEIGSKRVTVSVLGVSVDSFGMALVEFSHGIGIWNSNQGLAVGVQTAKSKMQTEEHWGNVMAEKCLGTLSIGDNHFQDIIASRADVITERTPHEVAMEELLQSRQIDEPVEVESDDSNSESYQGTGDTATKRRLRQCAFNTKTGVKSLQTPVFVCASKGQKSDKLPDEGRFWESDWDQVLLHGEEYRWNTCCKSILVFGKSLYSAKDCIYVEGGFCTSVSSGARSKGGLGNSLIQSDAVGGEKGSSSDTSDGPSSTLLSSHFLACVESYSRSIRYENTGYRHLDDGRNNERKESGSASHSVMGIFSVEEATNCLTDLGKFLHSQDEALKVLENAQQEHKCNDVSEGALQKIWLQLNQEQSDKEKLHAKVAKLHAEGKEMKSEISSVADDFQQWVVGLKDAVDEQFKDLDEKVAALATENVMLINRLNPLAEMEKAVLEGQGMSRVLVADFDAEILKQEVPEYAQDMWHRATKLWREHMALSQQFKNWFLCAGQKSVKRENEALKAENERLIADLQEMRTNRKDIEDNLNKLKAEISNGPVESDRNLVAEAELDAEKQEDSDFPVEKAVELEIEGDIAEQPT